MLKWRTIPSRLIRGLFALSLGLLAAACGGERRAQHHGAPDDSLGAIARDANRREQEAAGRQRAVPDTAAVESGSGGMVLHDEAAPPTITSPRTTQRDGSIGYPSRTGFRSRARLTEHYEKHGAEFGEITLDEYLHLAQQLRDAPVGGEVLEVVRDDGVVSRFDRRSGAFLAFDPDGTIRTFFRPNDGEAYFRRQARRRPGR